MFCEIGRHDRRGLQGTKGLRIPDAVPVIEVAHTGIDQDGAPFEVTVFTMRADYNGLDYRMPVED